MNGIHCDIVKDLLPLYVDDVCSEKSREMIEKHLEECEECRKYCELLLGKSPEVVVDRETSFFKESEFIQKIKKKITLDMICVGFMIFLFITMGSIMWNRYAFEPGFGLFGLIDQRLDIDDVQIKNIYQLKSGEIYFELKSDKKITWPYVTPISYDEERESYYSHAMLTYSWWQDYVEGNVTVKEAGFVYSTNHVDATGKACEISEIYLVGKDDKKLLIWKEGQKLEMASNYIEKEVKRVHPEDEDDRGAFWVFSDGALATME